MKQMQETKIMGIGKSFYCHQNFMEFDKPVFMNEFGFYSPESTRRLKAYSLHLDESSAEKYYHQKMRDLREEGCKIHFSSNAKNPRTVFVQESTIQEIDASLVKAIFEREGRKE